MPLQFNIEKQDPNCGGRAGVVTLGEKSFKTPVFMPVASLAAVRTLTASEVEQLGAEIILGNALHLSVRPGPELIERAGGLHKFMSWPGAILTDSGGYQVFSLAEISRIREEGVEFKSPFDGSLLMMTPEQSIGLQRRMGSDIVMAFDECPPHPVTKEKAHEALCRTDRWLDRCIEEAGRGESINLFGIIQGGVDDELRRESLRRTLSKPHLAGLAIGGLSVGEEAELMYGVLAGLLPQMPVEKPRYLMGVGTPENLLQAVKEGVDMFDCVLPTRNARNGTLFTSRGRLNLPNAAFREDLNPLDKNCDCFVCRTYSRAYLRHLFTCKEMLAYRLCSLHNLHFYLQLMRRCRQAVLEGAFEPFYRQTLRELGRGWE